MNVDVDDLILDLLTGGFAALPCSEPFRYELQRTLRLAHDHFSATPAMCHSTLSTEMLAGYREMGIEYSQSPDRPDLMESISLSCRTLKHPINDKHSEFEQVFHAVGVSLFDIAMHVTEVLAKYFTGRSSSGMCGDYSSFVQTNYYQPHLHRRETLQDTHPDSNLFTLVYSDGPGLELVVKPSRYKPVDFESGCLLLIPGEILSLLTGNHINQLYHRVKTHREFNTRCSIMCFANPPCHESIQPWIVNNTNKDVDIRERVEMHSQNFGLPPMTYP